MKFGTVKKPIFPLTNFILPSLSDPVVEMGGGGGGENQLSEFNTKYSGGIDCFSIYLASAS